jgi:hypothetical protein
VLRKIFGPERDGVTVERKRLHNEELLTKYNLRDQIQKNEMAWTCSMDEVGIVT